MRACGQKPEFLIDKNVLVGIRLPADFVSEHEWGISKMKRQFGIPTDLSPTDEPFGIKRRQATKCPTDQLWWDERGDTAVLAMFWRWAPKGKETLPLLDELPHELRLIGDREIAGAWSEENFGVLVKGSENIERLREIYDAIKRVDFIAFLGGASIPVFENAGLNLAIASRVAPEFDIKMRAADEDRAKLKIASDATGIVAKINNDWYFALSPRWKHGSDRKSAFPVVYWLNPREQQKNNCGWYTVEELEQWMQGKGPIPMANRLTAAAQR